MPNDNIPVAPTTPAAPVDEFADAFASLQAPEPAPAAVADAPAPVAEAPAAAPTEPAATAPATAVPPTEPAAVPTEPAAAAPAPAVSVADELAALRAENAALKAAPAPAAAAAPTPTPAPAPAPAPTPVYTTEEQAQIDAYQKEWPDIHAGEALIRKQEYRHLVEFVFSEFNKAVIPLQQFVEKQGPRTQYDDIVKLVPDYDDVRDKTLAWIDTQPEYLKAAYKRVTSEGTPADVADLIDRFKKETGHAQAAAPAVPATAAAPAPAPAAPAALPAASAAVVPGLRVVQSSRSDQSAPIDKNNFDDAFAEFAKAK